MWCEGKRLGFGPEQELRLNPSATASEPGNFSLLGSQFLICKMGLIIFVSQRRWEADKQRR